MGPTVIEIVIITFLGLCAVLPVPIFFAVIANILEKWRETRR